MESLLPGLLHQYGLDTVLISIIVGGVVAFYRALKTGKLVPGSTVALLTEQWEDRLREAQGREQIWQKAAMNSLEASRDATDQVKAQQAFGEIVVKALAADKIGKS